MTDLVFRSHKQAVSHALAIAIEAKRNGSIVRFKIEADFDNLCYRVRWF